MKKQKKSKVVILSKLSTKEKDEDFNEYSCDYNEFKDNSLEEFIKYLIKNKSSASFMGTILNGIVLKKIDFIDTNIDFDLSGSEHENSIYESCNFKNIYLDDAIFKETTFIKCNFVNVSLEECNFKNTKFIDCHFNNTIFNGSKFDTCKFINCEFYYCSFYLNTIDFDKKIKQSNKAIFNNTTMEKYSTKWKNSINRMFLLKEQLQNIEFNI